MLNITATNITSKSRESLAIAVAVALFAACSHKPANEQSSSGTIDSTVLRTSSSAVTPAVGPGVQITRTDEKSVSRALEYRLTPDNWTKFLAAADSLSAMSGRDTATHTYLSKNITDAGSTDPDAGLKWLETNDSVSKAISSAGISVRDYFVASIAAGAAARFLNDPKAAPGTPTLAQNAEFLRSRKSDLDRLQAMRENRPVVTSSP
jgi:hypothetical protein